MASIKSNIGDKEYIENIAIQNAETTDDFLVKRYNKKRVQSFFGKLGNSLGLVVTVLPFAGLLLAIGGILLSKGITLNEQGEQIGHPAMLTAGLILSDLGNAVYANLGLFFMLAIIMGFTGNRGMAVYSAIIGYIAFVGFQLPFIRYEDKTGAYLNAKQSLDDAKYFTIWFWGNIQDGHGLDMVTQLDNVLGMKQAAYPTAADIAGIMPGNFARFSYQGIKTLNTGVLGGIALGFIYSWEFNHTKDWKLPAILSFFEGEKFTSVVMLLTAPIVSSIFIIVWPAVNFALGYIGIGLDTIPYGINTLLYGTIFQILLPFQAHMAFISPLWWTSAGGSLANADTQRKIIEAMMYRISYGSGSYDWAGGASAGIAQEASFYAQRILPWAESMMINVDGKDINLDAWLLQHLSGNKADIRPLEDLVRSLTFSNNVDYFAKDKIVNIGLTGMEQIDWAQDSGDQLISVDLLTKNPGFDMHDAWSVNLKATKYITGGFANDLFMLPAAGFGMWLTLPEDRRKEKFGLYLGAILSSFLFGVSEPIIFMFAFACPLIYFLFYCPLFGLLSWASIFMQSKVGSTFSQGLMDYVINGILPTATKTGGDAAMQTQLWWPIVFGAVTFVPTMYAFKAMFIKAEFAVPGSYAYEEGIGTSESRYTSIKPSYDEALDFFGGLGNIEQWDLVTKNKAKIKVKRPDRVLQANDFSKRNIKSMYVEDDMYTVTFNIRKGVNIDYVAMIARMIDLLNRQGDWKFVVKEQKANFKEQLTGKQLIKEIKDNAKEAIKKFDKEQQAKIDQIKRADKGFKQYIKSKKADPKFDNKQAIAQHNADVKKQLAQLKAERKAFVKQTNDVTRKQVATIKKQRKPLNTAAARKQFKQDMKLLSITKKKIEQINDVSAKWLFEQHKIEETSNIDKFKLQHELAIWDMKHLQEKELTNIAYEANKAKLKAGFLLDDEPIGKGKKNQTVKAQLAMLKANYKQQMEQLNKIDKKAIKASEKQFKVQLKQMEAANKKKYALAENK